MSDQTHEVTFGEARCALDCLQEIILEHISEPPRPASVETLRDIFGHLEMAMDFMCQEETRSMRTLLEVRIDAIKHALTSNVHPGRFSSVTRVDRFNLESLLASAQRELEALSAKESAEA